MNTSLSQVKRTSKGFTLVELMVVIAIIAVLAVIGLTLFSNAQQGARNAKRQSDLKAISNAMEVHYNPTAGAGCATGLTGTYCAINAGWFSAQIIPADPVATATYCAASSLVAGAATPANMAASPTGVCVAGAAGYAAVAGGTNPPANTTTWKVCTTLEPYNAATPTVYCVSNQQQ